MLRCFPSNCLGHFLRRVLRCWHGEHETLRVGNCNTDEWYAGVAERDAEYLPECPAEPHRIVVRTDSDRRIQG